MHIIIRSPLCNEILHIHKNGRIHLKTPHQFLFVFNNDDAAISLTIKYGSNKPRRLSIKGGASYKLVFEIPQSTIHIRENIIESFDDSLQNESQENGGIVIDNLIKNNGFCIDKYMSNTEFEEIISNMGFEKTNISTIKAPTNVFKPITSKVLTTLPTFKETLTAITSLRKQLKELEGA